MDVWFIFFFPNVLFCVKCLDLRRSPRIQNRMSSALEVGRVHSSQQTTCTFDDIPMVTWDRWLGHKAASV